MKPRATLIIVLLLVVAFVAFGSMYTVKEGQLALVLRLGKIVTDKSTGKAEIKYPGLHFKLPFVSRVRKFDIRLQTLDIQSSRIVTAEKKDVIVDYFIKWRINNLPLYYTRTGDNEQTTQLLLSQQLNDSLRAEFGKRTIPEVVSDDRAAIMLALRKQANETASHLGISVIDVRIKRIDLPTEVSTAVFQRMRAERNRVAAQHRADGQSAAEAIRADADAQVTVILATAKKEAEQVRAQGDATAARIYAEAFGKDPSFYSFYRSLLAYKNTFNHKRDLLVLGPDNQFFKYFDATNNRNNVKRKASSG